MIWNKMEKKLRVRMARGGYLPLLVEGSVYKDTDGSGQRLTTVEIEALRWPRGGLVKELFIADMKEVEKDFLEAEEVECVLL